MVYHAAVLWRVRAEDVTGSEASQLHSDRT